MTHSLTPKIKMDPSLRWDDDLFCSRFTHLLQATTSMKVLIDNRPVSGSAGGMRALSMVPECNELRRYMTIRLNTPSTCPIRSNSTVSPSM